MTLEHFLNGQKRTNLENGKMPKFKYVNSVVNALFNIQNSKTQDVFFRYRLEFVLHIFIDKWCSTLLRLFLKTRHFLGNFRENVFFSYFIILNSR